MNITPRLENRIEQAERIIAAWGRPRRPWGFPKRVWRAYLHARMRFVLNDIVAEFRRIRDAQ